MSFRGVVVVAGANSATARALARRFAGESVSLALFSRDKEKLLRFREELSLPPERTLIEAFDFREADSASQAAALVKEKFQGCDVLVNLIGGWIGGKSIDAFEPADYALMLEQHFWTTLHLVRAFLPLLRLSRCGRVFVVSSPTAALPPANNAPYSVAKAAQEALMLALAQEAKGSSLTANVLRVTAIDVEGLRDRKLSEKTAGRTTPEEIAETIFFLCSEAANKINGARIPLYGSP
ncbi:MAG: SDR family oxidoreductase [Anaerolineales bacterium]|nr:SDR family oxidoreductase [Anaerolineales bacterium]MDW8160530.1 SDR family oxidoreductase [Anaerolineales bacterium]